MAGSLLGLGNSASAAFVYTDINPDKTFINPGNIYNLDMNNDATTDFSIEIIASSGYKTIRVKPATSTLNEIAGSFDATAFNANANINGNSGLYWTTSSNKVMERIYSAASQGGPWVGAVNKYLGLRFVVSGNTYYGWARLDVTTTGHFTIKDYGYNNITGQGVLAGQGTPTGMDQFSNPEINILSFEKNMEVIFGDQAEAEGTIIVSDLEGKEIKNIIISQTKTAIDLQDIKAGIYLVAIRQKDYYTTKKIALLL